MIFPDSNEMRNEECRDLCARNALDTAKGLWGTKLTMPLINYVLSHFRCCRQATVDALEVAGSQVVIILDI
jgi:hypothetical protein